MDSLTAESRQARAKTELAVRRDWIGSASLELEERTKDCLVRR